MDTIGTVETTAFFKAKKRKRPYVVYPIFSKVIRKSKARPAIL